MTETIQQQIIRLEKQIKLLKRIIAELTAADNLPLPFTSEIDHGN